MIVELKDKGIKIEFPDDMTPDQIKDVIKRKFYSEALSEGSQEMISAPMPAVPPEVIKSAGETIRTEGPKQLPVLGGLAGAMLTRNPSWLLRSLGAAGGASLGGMAERGITGGEPFDPGSMAKDAAIGGAQEFGGNLAQRALFEPAGRGAGQLATWLREEGLPKLAGKTPGWIKELTGMSFSGSALQSRYRSQIQDWAMRERQELLGSISEQIKLPFEIGRDVGKSVHKIFKEPKQLYDDIARMGGDFQVSGETKQIAHKWMDHVDAQDQALLIKLTGEKLTMADVSEMLGGRQVGLKDLGLRKQLKESIMKDLAIWDKETGTKFAMARKAADEAYKEIANEWATNPRALAILHEYDPKFKLKIGGKTVVSPSDRLSTRPEEVVDKMFKTGDATELAQLKDAMPKELWDGALASWFDEMFTKTGAYNSQTRQFNPWPWQEAWLKRRHIIEAVEPEVAKRVDRFTEITVSARDQLVKEVPTLMQQAKHLALPGALVFGGYQQKIPLWSIPVIDGFAGVMAWRFLGPSGKGSFAKLVGNTVRVGVGETGTAIKKMEE